MVVTEIKTVGTEMTQRFAKRLSVTSKWEHLSYVGAALLGLLLANASAYAQTAGTTPAVDVKAIQEATCWLLHFTQGTYGALLTGSSAVGAIAAAAVGSARNAINCAIVAICCWMIHPTAVFIFKTDIDCKGTFKITVPDGGITNGGVLPGSNG